MKATQKERFTKIVNHGTEKKGIEGVAKAFEKVENEILTDDELDRFKVGADESRHVFVKSFYKFYAPEYVEQWFEELRKKFGESKRIFVETGKYSTELIACFTGAIDKKFFITRNYLLQSLNSYLNQYLKEQTEPKKEETTKVEQKRERYQTPKGEMSVKSFCCSVMAAIRDYMISKGIENYKESNCELGQTRKRLVRSLMLYSKTTDIQKVQNFKKLVSEGGLSEELKNWSDLVSKIKEIEGSFIG